MQTIQFIYKFYSPLTSRHVHESSRSIYTNEAEEKKTLYLNTSMDFLHKINSECNSLLIKAYPHHSGRHTQKSAPV